jgi:hypothetical protein
MPALATLHNLVQDPVSVAVPAYGFGYSILLLRPETRQPASWQSESTIHNSVHSYISKTDQPKSLEKVQVSKWTEYAPYHYRIL